jgi:aminopeptidase N
MRHRVPSFVVLVAACTSACNRSDTPAAMPTTAATAANDVHSCARPDEVVVRHVELDLDLDFAQKVARGTCALRVERRTPQAPLWLDTQDLAIEAVTTDDGKPVPFSPSPVDPILGTPLRVDLPAGCTRVTLRYHTSPGSAAMQWLEPAQTAGGKLPFLFTQGQAILTRSWIPLQDSPAVRVTWNATVRAPAGLRPLMSARTRGGDAAHGWTFAMDKPVPSYLIALACGDLVERAISERCAVWAETATIDRAAKELEDDERMVAACEQLFGPYRWGRYDLLVLPPSFPFGGMENPTLTFATPTILAGDKSLVALVAHELSHSWSGNLVTNATWRDFWLNEGFTVYLEQRIMEHVYGRERAEMEIALEMQKLRDELRTLPPGDQVLHIDLAGRNPDDGMTEVPYQKGAAFLRRLEQVFGRDRFDPFLRRWFDEHAFSSVTTATFEDFLQRELLAGDPAKARQIDVLQWLHQPGLPVDAPVPAARAFAVVDSARARVLQEHTAAAVAGVQWNTQQWLRFLDGLSADAALLAALDAEQKFTASGNCEILCAWLLLAIAADYQPAVPKLEEFLLGVGRRKFVKPLYEALLKRPDGVARARSIYARARPRYHAVTVRTLDELLGWPPK